MTLGDRLSINIMTNETNNWFCNSPTNQPINVSAYSLDWTRVRVVVDTANNTFSLWFNDVLKVSNAVPFVNISNGIDGLGLVSGRGGKGHPSYVDDIRIRVLP